MKNKALLITGASSDIGCELIRQVHEEYDVIYAHYYSSYEVLKQLQQDIGDKLRLVQADFSNMDDVYRMIDIIKNDEVKINNIVHLSAPKFKNVKLVKKKWEDFEKELQQSVYSITTIINAFVKDMAKDKYGRIVLMLSSSILNTPPKYLTPYVTAKFAALGLVKSLSSEFSNKGITVNGVSPEMIETKFLSEVSDLIVEKNAQESPLGRNLQVTDVVPLVKYLLSDNAEAITGQNYAITGGR